MRLENTEREKLGEDLRAIVARDHSLEGLITKILENFKNISN